MVSCGTRSVSCIASHTRLAIHRRMPGPCPHIALIFPIPHPPARPPTHPPTLTPTPCRCRLLPVVQAHAAATTGPKGPPSLSPTEWELLARLYGAADPALLTPLQRARDAAVEKQMQLLPE